MNKFVQTITSLLMLSFACTSQAHFQMLYTEDAALESGAATDWALVFSHPFSNGYPMNMGTPKEFYVVHDRGEDVPNKTTDLIEYLKPVTWTNSDDEKADAYTASLPKAVTRSIGDYNFVLTPEPYFEAEEDKYIQQITKTVINVGGVPGAWDAPMGLPVEIVPLDKPYANWVGGVFRAVVLANGQPVPHAEIEIEYLNHDPLIDQATFNPVAKVTPPQSSFATMSIRANAQGEVMIGLPKAGWWGICALDLDDGLQHEGKGLSLDAVLWVRAYDINWRR